MFVIDNTVLSNFAKVGKIHLLNLRVSGTIGVLGLGVKKGILTINEANEILREMIKKGFYSPVDDLKEIIKQY
ncbi:DUF3368 domain-containing protein [Thermococcus argininiproducens]|uniref:DUF3368 domain-containing protein n=1 Tax=Thermococcus argininiproducens TaxID=2866384 RepID=A0A9E7SD60_9EURY|nr:DUF3368 domain-containing protein [Thermococcus argininiproducens]USH00460.1 DUF3368 domain-containing protein [Thermococcus argininiproducens]